MIFLAHKHLIHKTTSQVLHQVQGHGSYHKPSIMVGYDAESQSHRIDRAQFKDWIEAHKVGDVWLDSGGHKQVIVALKQRTKNTVTATLENTWYAGHPKQGEVYQEEVILEGRAI